MSESTKPVESKKSLEQVEREQMTRRQALRKFGFGAGLSAIMLLGVDDLARMVGERMRQMEGDNKVADQIAKEFQGAGIALADGGSPCESDPHPNCCQAMQSFKKTYLGCCGKSGSDLEFCIANARSTCASTSIAYGCAADNYCSKQYLCPEPPAD